MKLNKQDIFKKELEYVKDPDIKESLSIMIDTIPDYFFHIVLELGLCLKILWLIKFLMILRFLLDLVGLRLYRILFFCTIFLIYMMITYTIIII